MALGKTVALLVIALIVGGAIGYGAFALTATGSTSTTTTTVTTGASVVTSIVTVTAPGSSSSGSHQYTIGAVLPLTGTLASFGNSMLKAIKLAVNQMNANLTAAGSNVQFSVVSADDAGTPQGALTGLQSEYQSAGVQVVIGPLTSGEVLGVAQYAAQNHIVVMPGAATATSLRIPDYIIRPGQPGDQFAGQADAQVLIQSGIKNVVYIYREDTSEIGTYNISSAVLTAAGIKVDGIGYVPNQADYSAQVQTASSDIQQFLSSGGTTKNTAVFLGGYGTEAQNIFQHSATDQYLSEVRWYGIEALDDNSLFSSSVGSFMAQVNLTITAPSSFSSPQLNYFNSTYTAAYGAPPEPYSNYFYDNAWIAMLSILAAGNDNGQNLLKIVPIIADHYYGASSTPIWLDQNGDQTIAYYTILEVVTKAGAITVTEIGQYNGGTNQLTLTS